MALGLGWTSVARLKLGWRNLAAPLAIALVLAACLLLTKSRTGVLAAGAGMVLLFVLARPTEWRMSWWVWGLAASGATAVVAAAILSNGLDRFVLTEAPKSLLYRLEYWQATLGMIRAHPLLGVGLTNLWVPKIIHQVEKIPVLGTGKLDLKRCRDLALEAAAE